jgi:hypothetical protein
LRRSGRFLLRQDAGAGQHLDPVGAALDVLPDPLAQLVGAVGDPGEALEPEVRREAVQIAVAAGRAERQRRHRHARTWQRAFVDRVPERDVDEFGRTDVAHAREPGLERALRVGRRAHRRVDRAPAERVGVVVLALHRQVRVHVDQAGRQRAAAQIDGLGAGWNRQAAADLRDALAFDEDHRIVGAAAGCRIDEMSGADGDAPRGGGRLLTGGRHGQQSNRQNQNGGDSHGRLRRILAGRRCGLERVMDSDLHKNRPNTPAARPGRTPRAPTAR